ncbi:MAG: YidC/Oxa1 family membrane protein insertase [Nitriliruptorales bacterium]|nr:YidC/Oxa1 family membrane protein insertase [Nitriliruptorales bacterium]
MGDIWGAMLDGFRAALELLHGWFEPLFGDAAWGWAIIGLTIAVRLLLLPLAIKQTRSMRAMQALQPQIKKLQKKHKVDRDLLKKDPEQYRKKKQKLNEEMMALYKEEGVNPASGCLPLLLQAPIFFALFRVLQDGEFTELATAPFYFITNNVDGLGDSVSAAGWPGWLLIVLMAATMFVSQRQMLARNQAEGAQAQQQKIMMYVMPVFLAAISFNFPLGVLLYWVTTNFWQMGQQYVILKEVQHEVEEGTLQEKVASDKASKGKGPKGSSSSEPKKRPSQAGTSGNGRASDKTEPAPNQNKRKKKRDHLPKRGQA